MYYYSFFYKTFDESAEWDGSQERELSGSIKQWLGFKGSVREAVGGVGLTRLNSKLLSKIDFSDFIIAYNCVRITFGDYFTFADDVGVFTNIESFSYIVIC